MGCACGTSAKAQVITVPAYKPLRSPMSSTPIPAIQPVTKQSDPAISTFFYFDSFGRGEIVRFLLKFLSIDFEDKRIDSRDWETLKSQMEFGQCPMLFIDNRKLVQTRAILRYVALKHGLYPGNKDLGSIYWLESLCDLVDDIRNPLIASATTGTKEKIEEMYGKTGEMLLMVEKRLMRNKNGKGWFIGSQISLADIVVFELLWDFFLQPGWKELHESRVPEKLRAYVRYFLSLYPHVSGYLSTRPASKSGY